MPTLIKTRKYLSVVLRSSILQMFLFLKGVVFFLTYSLNFKNLVFLLNPLISKFFISGFWASTKFKLRYSNNSPLTINFDKGHFYSSYKNLDYLLSFGKVTNYTHGFKTSTFRFLNHISVLEFPFHKKIYNTFIFLILFMLSNSYTSFKNDFNLFYNIIYKPLNFKVLIFLNRFYFPTNNY